MLLPYTGLRITAMTRGSRRAERSNTDWLGFRRINAIANRELTARSLGAVWL